ncbi:MAG TPA: ATP-binding protein [Candidatus Binatia bacterium]|nr:ATP-binding protein [Candidatus Binatia bacterium]
MLGSNRERVEDRWLVRSVLAVTAVAAIGSAIRVGALIGVTMPGFCLSRNLRIERVGDPLWPALRDGLVRGLDRIVSVRLGDETVIVNRPDDVDRVAATSAPGTLLSYTVERRGQLIEVAAPTVRFSLRSFLAFYGCAVIPAAVALGLAWWTVRRQPKHPAARRFLLLTALAYVGNIAFCESMLYHRLDAVYVGSFHLLAVAFVNFALFFPRPRRIVVQRPWIITGLFVLAGALGVGIAIAQATGHPLTARWEALGPLLLAGGELFLGISVLQSAWAHDDRETRERARVVLFGYGVAVPVLGVGLLPTAVTGSTIPANLFFPATLIMTGSLAYAIVRGNLFELRHVLRRRSVTVALAVFWSVLVFTLALLINISLSRYPTLTGVAVAMLAVASGLGFAAARAGLEYWIDRVFFRSRAAYKPTIQQLATSFTRLLRANDVLQHTHAIVAGTLAPARLRVCRFDDHTAADMPASLRSWLAQCRGPQSRVSSTEAAAALDGCEAEVAAPIAFEGSLRAALLLGPKRSGELYTSEDLDLLGTIANQAAIALENAYSFEALDSLRRNLEREVDLRTRELRDTQAQLVHAEKMASLGQLVAGVAHELNNPLGAVDGNLAVLQDYHDRLRATLSAFEQAAPECGERFAAIRRRLDLDNVLADLDRLLATCSEGSQRARRIVQDLRTFSRLDEAELKRVDLNAAISITLDLLHHRQRRGIRVETALDPLPPVECYASQVNQVFLNLLTNALDAVESVGEGVVRVSSHFVAPDWVEVVIHDTGPGVAPELRTKIFDPFFTTKPIGKGTGLGLSISYSIVAKHHGRLELDSSPPPGCTFRIRLPLRPLEPAVQCVGAGAGAAV